MVICWELMKKFEEVLCGMVQDLLVQIFDEGLCGEVVVLFGYFELKQVGEDDLCGVLVVLFDQMLVKEVVVQVVVRFGLFWCDIYVLVVELKEVKQ